MNDTRRRFIRVLGSSSVILAAAPWLAGCSEQMPAAAIEAWNGPGTEPDPRRWILSYAILAPHSHNLQSWVVDLSVPDEIVLRCDLSRLLPETDPYSRQIMMSHGTFLELLDLAARERGLRADITLFPEGAFGPEQLDRRPVARIRLVADPAVERDPLFAQILRRRTNRSLYDPVRPVPAEAWTAMEQAVEPHPLRFGFAGAERPDALARHRSIAAEAWRIELVTPRTILESFRVMRVRANPEDGRGKLVSITPRGERTRNDAIAALGQTLAQLRDAFGDAEIEAALPLLERMGQWLDANR